MVAEDLGIEILASHQMTLPSGKQLDIRALIKHFGAPHGMVVVDDYEMASTSLLTLIEYGYGYASNIGGTPADYDQTQMIEMLTDWGWSGANNKRPVWLS